MEKKLSKAINEVVSVITESDEFKECIELKKRMDENSEIKELVQSIKTLQKKYVHTLDDSLKIELEQKEEKLNNIPLYYSYQRKLAEVN